MHHHLTKYLNNNELETLRIARACLDDEAEKTINEWANLLLNDREALSKLPSFVAYSNLSNIGPDNDWNGCRSHAMKLKFRFDMEILAPAVTNLVCDNKCFVFVE